MRGPILPPWRHAGKENPDLPLRYPPPQREESRRRTPRTPRDGLAHASRASTDPARADLIDCRVPRVCPTQILASLASLAALRLSLFRARRSVAGGVLARSAADGLHQRAVNIVISRTAGDLRAIELADVEDVGHTGAFGVDLRQRDRQAELVERVRQREEEARSIFREHLDDGVAGGRAIVEQDLGGDRGARPLAPGRRRAGS